MQSFIKILNKENVGRQGEKNEIENLKWKERIDLSQSQEWYLPDWDRKKGWYGTGKLEVWVQEVDVSFILPHRLGNIIMDKRRWETVSTERMDLKYQTEETAD